MRGLLSALAVGVAAVVLSLPATGAAGLTRPQAVAAVRAILKKNAPICGYRVVRITARKLGKGWRVDGLLAGGVAGKASWNVVSRRPKAANARARDVAAGCPAPPEQPPLPPPPPPPPPPPAPATFVLGAGVTPEQQAFVARGLDLGAAYVRTTLGRELPAFSVYLEDDLEGIVQLYAATAPTTIEHARQIWQSNVGDADPRKVWIHLGSSAWLAWPDSERVKLIAHEEFHLLQFELSGQDSLNSSLDGVPRAGPWWLIEGVAEYAAHRVTSGAGLVRFADVHGEWVSRTKLTGNPLRSRETLRGFFAESEAYEISPLAVELLLGSRGDAPLVAYHEAVGRGTPWPDAFATAFGRSVDAFYAEFEAYRGTL